MTSPSRTGWRSVAGSSPSDSSLLGYGLGPEWVPGADGIPFRRAARTIVLDEADRLLLVRGHDSAEPSRSWWFTVGGGIDAAESARAGALRELREETGLRLAAEALVGPVLTRSALFHFARVTCRQDEEYFLARTQHTAVDRSGWTALERSVLDELRWWPLPELEEAAAGGAVIFPTELPGVVRRLLDGWDGSVPHLTR